ncbi:putative polysaccharide biosynthesis protein [Cohnella candidum]|uniref:Polysaccharide biosynthesis protein n=1 Tax=Cohnella candidum TaxID=2674991 RepID=A0A3G3K2C2_9BACL|nr:polysaccharide biosynthesis protein [Cohnella candidum]AYQ74613.1 polysaccharide biosynthesis protein [Cohnella candidum]
MSTERNPGPSAGKTVLKGAALLGGAALISKVIGTLQKIPLQNFAGDEVFGLYSAVYALAIMWMTLAAAGVPTAVSVMVAEREAEGDEAGAQRVVRWSFGLLCASGLLAFGILQAAAPLFADWMGAPGAVAAVRTSSIALLFSPAAAVLRGYRQGQMRMARPALSQVIEQTARVAFMLAMLWWAIDAGWNASAATAAVHGGLAAGAVGGLVAMLWPERRRTGAGVWIQGAETPKKRSSRPDGGNVRIVIWPETRKTLVRRIITVALPVAAASVVAPLFGLIDAFSIPRLLQNAGSEAAASLAQFGVYNRGIALLQLVLMAAGGAASALVPALTASRTRGDDASETAEKAAFALRLGWWLGGASAIGLALLAAPIDITLFADDAGSRAIVLMAPAAVFGTLQAVSGGLLQGRGDLKSPAVNLAVAAVFKLALNALLVPAYGIEGAAAGMVAAYGAAAVLNALSLRQKLAVPAARLATAWKPAAALAAMAAAVALAALALGALTQGLPARAGALLTALPGVAVGALAFAAALIAAGAVGPRQWRELPGCGPGSRMDARLTRLQAAVRRKTAPSPSSPEG